jgi:outer membrane protein TolC
VEGSYVGLRLCPAKEQANRRSPRSAATRAPPAQDVGTETQSSRHESTLGSAFQQVEDGLAALRILEQESQEQRRAVESAQESLQLSTNRYRGGVDTYLQVVTAQTITLGNQRTEIDILRRRLGSSVLLVKALGGGWTVEDLPKP